MNNQIITGPNVIEKGNIIMRESVGQGDYEGEKIILAHNTFTGAPVITYKGRTAEWNWETLIKGAIDAIDTVLALEE
ncbi:hypothetical protein [uncultured Abiotrophia sp.]|uniref:hypothetical protein n=1 Tax=uncultured Abiotrophia sp. TaxID=316094 RepID=UPI0028D7975D|nr:hypothetical protein [uncultured Abiotrophia sp.]